MAVLIPEEECPAVVRPAAPEFVKKRHLWLLNLFRPKVPEVVAVKKISATKIAVLFIPLSYLLII